MHRGRKLTEKKLQKMIKEGRCQGEKEEYQPLTKVTEFASNGFATRTRGKKINRIHEIHSELEYAVYCILEWNDSVVDIREQYGLFDENKSLEEVQSIAEELGIKYSKLNKKDEIYVMDVDFMITQIVDGKSVQKARAVKISKELMNERVIEKFQIAKKYCERHGIDFAIITEKEIDWKYVRNIQWFLPFKKLDNRGLECKDIQYIEEILVKIYRENPEDWQRKMKAIDNTLKLRQGTVLAVFKYLVCNGFWEVDLFSEAIHTIYDVKVIAIKKRVDLDVTS